MALGDASAVVDVQRGLGESAAFGEPVKAQRMFFEVIEGVEADDPPREVEPPEDLLEGDTDHTGGNPLAPLAVAVGVFGKGFCVVSWCHLLLPAL